MATWAKYNFKIKSEMRPYHNIMNEYKSPLYKNSFAFNTEKYEEIMYFRQQNQKVLENNDRDLRKAFFFLIL